MLSSFHHHHLHLLLGRALFFAAAVAFLSCRLAFVTDASLGLLPMKEFLKFVHVTKVFVGKSLFFGQSRSLHVNHGLQVVLLQQLGLGFFGIGRFCAVVAHRSKKRADAMFFFILKLGSNTALSRSAACL